MSSKEPAKEEDPKKRWTFTIFPKDVTAQQVSDHLKKIHDESVAEKAKKPDSTKP